MDAAEVAEQIKETLDEERAEQKEVERFRSGVALLLAILAMLLTLASLGGENAGKEMVNANIQASNYWAFYQAKNIRQTSYELAALELETRLLADATTLTPAARQRIEAALKEYREKAARYESEPDPNDPANPLRGEGKKELMAQARHWEKQREHAQAQDPNFDYSTGLFQIAIVLGSVAILANSRWIVGLAAVMGAAATILMLNGFFLWFPLPG